MIFKAPLMIFMTHLDIHSLGDDLRLGRGNYWPATVASASGLGGWGQNPLTNQIPAWGWLIKSRSSWGLSYRATTVCELECGSFVGLVDHNWMNYVSAGFVGMEGD